MDKFNFFVQSDISDDIFKAAKKEKGEKRYENMVIEGVASTNDEDSHGDTMTPSGFEFEEFKKYGKVNLEHYPARKGDPYYWIGDVLDAKVEGSCFIVKSKLWKAHPLARNFWDTMMAMKESGAKNMPGYSIEGKKLEVDPHNKKKITKAKINNIAVTFTPVLKNSWIDIAKGGQGQDFIQHEIGDIFFFKAEHEGKIITVDSNFNLKIEKAVDLQLLKPLLKESVKKKVVSIAEAGNIYKAALSGTLKDESIYKVVKKLQDLCS